MICSGVRVLVPYDTRCMHAAPEVVLEAFAALRDSVDTAYLLSRDLRLLATNAGWTQFALANDGGGVLHRWTTGSSILDAIPEPLGTRFRTRFERAFMTGEPWSLDYECSSATEYREFRMTAESAGGRVMLVRHSLRVARPHDREGEPANDEAYVFDEVIRMCMYCRRVKRVAVDRWDWVAAYVHAMPSNVSHCMCPPCAELHAND